MQVLWFCRGRSLNGVWGRGVRGWGGSWSWALNTALDFNTEAESIQDRNKNKHERTGQPKEKQEFQVEFDLWYVGIWRKKNECKHRLPQDVRGSWVLCEGVCAEFRWQLEQHRIRTRFFCLFFVRKIFNNMLRSSSTTSMEKPESCQSFIIITP